MAKTKTNVAALYRKYVGHTAAVVVLDNVERKSKTGLLIRRANPGVTIPVRVLDVRSTYGRIHVLVRPVGGIGSVWIEQHRVRLVEPKYFENKAPIQAAVA